MCIVRPDPPIFTHMFTCGNDNMETVTAYLGLTFNEGVIVILTLIIALSAVVQAICTRKQTKIAELQMELARESEERQRKRETPNIKFAIDGYSHGRIDPDGNSTTDVYFGGFCITNASSVDVTITNFNLERGIREGESTLAKSVWMTPVEEFKGKKLSDMELPRRLQHGESMRFLFEAHLLRRETDGEQPRYRPQCQDSLGNTYTTPFWVEWTDSGVATYEDPGPGYLSSEEILERQREIRNIVLPHDN